MYYTGDNTTLPTQVMVADPRSTDLTPAEYLDWEEQQPLKYGYIDGEIYAMTGGTLPHAEIALNLASA
jgi:Uma2 family endonuclease